MGRKSGKSFSISTLKKIKSLNGRYKRSRTPPVSKCCKDEPDPDLYAIKIELIAELEKLSKQRLIDLCYGDETGSPADHICGEDYVPYGWQFPDEDIYISVEKGYKINIWGLISRYNQHHWAITEQHINASFVFEQL